MKVTMAKYYTPNGNYIHGIGITPDIVIELPDGKSLADLTSRDEDLQLQAALEALKNRNGTIIRMWQPLWLILQLSVQTITMVAVNPLFWLTLWFAYRYYRQYEWDKASARRLALASFWEGLLAGLFVVWLVAGLGIMTIPSPALYCMGPVSMLLSLIRPRFLCMAYGAGITLGLGRVLGLPVDAPGIMALVAILHLAEGLLVLLFGGRHTVTIYQQRQRRLVPVSGIYRFWPVSRLPVNQRKAVAGSGTAVYARLVAAAENGARCHAASGY